MLRRVNPKALTTTAVDSQVTYEGKVWTVTEINATIIILPITKTDGRTIS